MPQKSFKPARLGVIGLGRFGRLHSLTVAALAEAELVGLVARRQASLDALAGELPGVPGWTSLKEAELSSRFFPGFHWGPRAPFSITGEPAMFVGGS